MVDKSSGKLCIYIPSYRRSDLLERQLKELVPQIAKFLGVVRVLVSLNEVDDLYQNVIEAYQSEQIKFRFNPGNIGGNANITLAFVFAEPDEFLWILSDDDMITENALDYIIPSLDCSYDLVHMGDYQILSDKKINMTNVFTATSGAGFGLISVVIFNMKSIKKYLEFGFLYLDSSFPHLAILLSALREKKEFLVKLVCHNKVFTSEPLVTHGGGNYSISYLGFGYLSDFFNEKQGGQLLNSWLHENWRGFMMARKINKSYGDKAIGYLAFRAPILVLQIYLIAMLNRIASTVCKIFR
jgi:glycosyltransferase involved in cell wall biosynthesis